MLRLSSAIALSSLIPFAFSDTFSTCSDLAQALPGLVFGPSDAPYKTEQTSYWNVGLWSDAPTCVVLPDSAEKASIAVKILNANTDVKFAVKSGGHDPNPGHSAIDGGVLISTSYMNQTVYDPSRSVAYVGPGQRWAQVIGALQPKYNVTVVGGRLGPIGVAGLLLGGGLSFLSAEYGLACDGIVEMETVLPDGTIANISDYSNPDLFRAMKGSGKNFGIVTKFTLRTHAIGQIWGGLRIYLADVGTTQADILTATHKFIEAPTDPKAAVIVSKSKTVGTLANIFMIFFFYNGAVPPSSAFSGLLELNALVDTTKAQGYADLLNANGQGVNSTGMRSSFRSMTLPSLPDSGQSFLAEAINSWDASSTTFSQQNPTSVMTFTIQPLQSFVGNQSTKYGGNAMGLAAGDKPRFVLELSDLWGSTTSDPALDATIYALRTNLTATIQTQSDAYIAQENPQSEISTYNPYFLNDATFNQDVMSSYKEVDLFRSIQKKLDPNGVFTNRVGGFSY